MIPDELQTLISIRIDNGCRSDTARIENRQQVTLQRSYRSNHLGEDIIARSYLLHLNCIGEMWPGSRMQPSYVLSESIEACGVAILIINDRSLLWIIGCKDRHAKQLSMSRLFIHAILRPPGAAIAEARSKNPSQHVG